MAALRGGATRYGPPAGLPELREAIAADSTKRRGAPATPEMVVVTPGAKPILFFAILALVDPGDEVLYPDPGFPIYRSMIRYVGGEPVPIRLLAEKQFALDVDQLVSRIGDKTRLIILNSPHNPTGGVIPEDGLRAIADAAVRHGVPVLSDEIYGRIVYDGEHRSIASLPGMQQLTIMLDGFSKSYAMTGWRLGYGVMPEPLAREVAKLQTNSTSCTATFTQHAGVAALTGDQAPVAAMVAEFRRRRERVVKGCGVSSGSAASARAGRSTRSPTSPVPATPRACSPIGCWTKPVWHACPARRSASSARAICASRTRTASRTSRRRCGGSAACCREAARPLRRRRGAAAADGRVHRRDGGSAGGSRARARRAAAAHDPQARGGARADGLHARVSQGRGRSGRVRRQGRRRVPRQRRAWQGLAPGRRAAVRRPDRRAARGDERLGDHRHPHGGGLGPGHAAARQDRRGRPRDPGRRRSGALTPGRRWPV